MTMARDVFYNGFEPTTLITETVLGEVEEFARGMELSEIVDYFGFELAEEPVIHDGEIVSEAVAGDLTEAEIKWLNKAFKRGRAAAKKSAVDNLFASMKDRNGQNASLPYLRRFADEWPGDDNVKEGDLLVFKASFK